MAIPALTDVILYTTTPLTDSDYAFNWTQTVAWLTTTYDVTFNTVTSTSTITSLGKSVALSNIASVKPSVYACQATSFTSVTGATVTITTVRASANVILSVKISGYINLVSGATAASKYLQVRVNRDSATEYAALNIIQGYVTRSPTNDFRGFIGGQLLFAGLSAGSHTFALEAKNGDADTTGYLGDMEIIAMEI
jgi:hypothetical protein